MDLEKGLVPIIGQVTLGIAVSGYVEPETTLSLCRLIGNSRRAIHLAMHKSCYVHVNREFIIRDAIKAGSTHLMFIDTDMVFPPDGIEQLIAHNKDIIGGSYNAKMLPLTSVVKVLDSQGKMKNVLPEELPKQAFRCAVVPTGFMCINLRRLTESMMKSPYFQLGPPEQFMGEDVNFCRRAQEAGLEVWCDPTIPLKHIGNFLY